MAGGLLMSFAEDWGLECPDASHTADGLCQFVRHPSQGFSGMHGVNALSRVMPLQDTQWGVE